MRSSRLGLYRLSLRLGSRLLAMGLRHRVSGAIVSIGQSCKVAVMRIGCG